MSPFYRLAVLVELLVCQAVAQTYPGFVPGTSTPLVVEYGTEVVSPPGEFFPPSAVALPPTVGTTSPLNGTYILLMVDPDITLGNATGLTAVHYLLPNLQSSPAVNSSNATLPYHPLLTSSAPLAQYVSPTPEPAGSVHKYTLLLFAQPANFSVPPYYQSFLPLNWSDVEARIIGTDGVPFNVSAFANASGLGEPVAGEWYSCSNGSSSATTTGTTTATSAGPTATFTAGAAGRGIVGAGLTWSFVLGMVVAVFGLL